MTVAIVGAATVVALRLANTALEPEGRNWWIVVEVMLGCAFLPAGALLLSRPGTRLLGAAYVVVGASQLLAAVAAEWAAWVADGEPIDGRVADAVEAGGLIVLAVVVPWLLPWRRRGVVGDPLRRWLALGVVAAVAGAILAVAPVDDVPAVDIIGPLLLLATVPLLAVGAVVGSARDDDGGWSLVSHRVLEWIVLSAGVVLIDTTVVAGVGAALGSDGPAWLLVATTGGLAVALEPARRWVRHLVDRVVYGQRDDPLALVRGVMAEVTTTVDVAALLPSLAATIAQAFRLDFVAIDVGGTDDRHRAAAHGAPTEHTEERSLMSGGAEIGRLTLGWRDGPALRTRDRAALADITPHIALAVAMVRLTDEVRRSSLAIVSTREEERRRIRRDLHDGLGPSLTGVGMGLRTVARRLSRSSSADAETMALLTRLADEVEASVGEVKRIVRDLRPTALDDHGLGGALTEFVRSLDGVLDVQLDLPADEPILPAAVEVATYRIATEAITNVVRHAAARTCRLHLEVNECVDIDVTDDGVGISPNPQAGVGLATMRERATELGGTVAVSPVAPHGTRVHVVLPLAVT
jgi:signal transduction histidine kinase